MSGLSKSFTRILAVGFVVASLAACTMTRDYFTPTASMDAAKLDRFTGDAVAADMVARLAEHVGPGTGTIALKLDNSTFAASLEKQLRDWGYAVDPDVTDASSIALAYMVDTADGQILARLSTPSVELTRIYSTSTGIAVPASPVSVMRRSES